MSEPSAGMMVTSNIRLVRPLGEGGMGSVWVADHLSLHTQVVVKFVARDLAESGEAIKRFAREAAAASQVKSPHVVQMLDHGVLESGAPYIVMELLEGRDLEQHLRASGRLVPREAAAIVLQLSRALSKAHERGIIHRDIKPSNVFLCDAGGGDLFVKLLDFGIAKGPEVGIVGSTTRTGSFIGSPYYMSPEQVVGAKTIDFRTDLWSLGVVAYEALTGDKPFFAETVGALALKIHRDPLPVPTKACPSLPSGVDAWFVRACAREPEARYASAREMAEALALSLGEGLQSGLQVDSLPAPTSGEVSLPSPAAETLRSGVDARSETGGGVGLVATETSSPSGRGKWLVLAGIAAAAVGIGFVVPRALRGDAAGPPPSTSTTASAPAMTSTPARPPPPATTLVEPPAEQTPASAAATSIVPAVSTTPTVAVTTKLAAAPIPSHASTVPAHASAIASAAPRPSASTSPPRPVRGSDDDIK